MKPSLLAAYEKARRVVESTTVKSLGPARHYISIFSKMFCYGNYVNKKEWEAAYFYREDLLRRFDIKLDEICKNLKENEAKDVC